MGDTGGMRKSEYNYGGGADRAHTPDAHIGRAAVSRRLRAVLLRPVEKLFESGVLGRTKLVERTASDEAAVVEEVGLIGDEGGGEEVVGDRDGGDAAPVTEADDEVRDDADAHRV